jgi:hypothetical protein
MALASFLLRAANEKTISHRYPLSSDYCKWFVCWGIASRPKRGRENGIAGYILSTGLARWVAVELAGFGPVGEGETGAKIAEGVVASDEGHAGGECVGRY